jgi:WXG100 family type VII secretion target
MSGFAVTLSAVQQAASVTATIADELGVELARLGREADAVLSGQWRGAAAGAFDRAWCSWQAGAQEVVAALDRMAELLATSEREYSLRDLASSDRLRLAAS